MSGCLAVQTARASAPEPAVSTRLYPARVKMARTISSSSASSSTIRMVLSVSLIHAPPFCFYCTTSRGPGLSGACNLSVPGPQGKVLPDFLQTLNRSLIFPCVCPANADKPSLAAL